MKKQLVNPKKIYSIDNGLSRANSVSVSEDRGRLLENLVYLHLRRKHRGIYYFREKGECDFLVKEGNRITAAFQVCSEVTEENRKRELAGLLEAMAKFNLRQGTIITANQEDELLEGNKKILLMPAWKWLLS